uniref:Odorant receptor n=1 Tax=Microplitis mediator TaxID=375433 RepID=A0A0H4K8Z4_9HYME|nr:odorant receptor 28 [Microplitis mediator]
MTRSLKLQDQETFDQVAKVLKWNKWLLSTLGLWPQSPNTFIFTVNFSYFVYHMAMEYLDLFLFIDNLEHVIENLTENMAFTQILVRIAMLKKYNRQLGEVVNEAFKDYDARIYRTDEERQVFIDYMKKAKLFIKLLCAFVTMTATSYYAKPITSPPPPPEGELDVEMENATMSFILPYRFHLFYQVNDSRTWALTYLSHFPFVFVSGFGQTAADCLMVTLVFHVSGKLASLAIRISEINTEPGVCKQELRSIIIEHDRLLKMGQSIEEAFSETLLAHLIGATSLVCILGYQLLVNYARGQGADLVTFFVFIFLVFLVLYAHCVVGESLITESFKVCEAYYDCLWYKMPKESSKTIVLCMARSQKPLGLTAGKFGAFCLSTLTDVVKTAMAYLSVLRTFLVIE